MHRGHSIDEMFANAEPYMRRIVHIAICVATSLMNNPFIRHILRSLLQTILPLASTTIAT